ncbi:hypothetical protein NADFUDRAFT_83691 [Nadsonia fulvescens var. elongata DSM 6958]|uniref:Bacterial surface antigen (D15) domain-containing protein n=1 Tax=Nadsonia fulvescens var. elongata DSM 6958 TaxID=857566 RepID=A0A1E3PHD5_9ASCO|nr:hypothetical protein NADFUDRAFT_83691 [Nadsonia fulvescens var. elongata DSM 6958]
MLFSTDLFSKSDNAKDILKQETIEAILSSNSTLPVKVNRIEVTGLTAARDSFLEHQIRPIIQENHTVESLLNALDSSSADLYKYGIFNDARYKLNLVGSSTAQPLEVTAQLKLSDTKRTLFETSAITRNDEGLLDGSLTYKNLFGGAESLKLSAAIGSTRLLKATSLLFSTPIANSTANRFNVEVSNNTTQNEWASHSVITNGISISATKALEKCHKGSLQIGISALNRNITDIKASGSDPVKAASGDDGKISGFFKYAMDTTDDKYYPSKGTNLSFDQEFFSRLSNESQNLTSSDEAAKSLSFSRTLLNIKSSKALDDKKHLIFNAYADFGYLASVNGASKSHLSDRFYLGGHKNIVGFQYNGIGPKDQDGLDSLGGDASINGGISFLAKLPNVCPKHSILSPLRLNLFWNAGNLVSAAAVRSQGTNIVTELLRSHSSAAGLGLVYRNDTADVNLSYSIPLAVKPTDSVKPGLSFNVSISW